MATANATAGETTGHPTITDDLRTFIRASGMSSYGLGKRSGVDRGIISRFMNGERSLTGPTLDALCATLGLALVQFDDLVEPLAAEAVGEPEAAPAEVLAFPAIGAADGSGSGSGPAA